MNDETVPDASAIWGSGLNDVWLVGGDNEGAIYHFNGAAWSSAESHLAQGLTGVWGSASGDVWVVGREGANPARRAVIVLARLSPLERVAFRHRRVDHAARDDGTATELRGADAVAKEIEVNRTRAAFASVLSVDGVLGAVVAPLGRLRFVLRFTLTDERISTFEVLGRPLKGSVTITPGRPGAAFTDGRGDARCRARRRPANVP